MNIVMRSADGSGVETKIGTGIGPGSRGTAVLRETEPRHQGDLFSCSSHRVPRQRDLWNSCSNFPFMNGSLRFA